MCFKWMEQEKDSILEEKKNFWGELLKPKSKLVEIEAKLNGHMEAAWTRASIVQTI